MQEKICEIMNGYRKECENLVWDFVDHVIKNRNNLNLRDIMLRCEHIARRIADFEEKAKRAFSLIGELRDESGGVASN